MAARLRRGVPRPNAQAGSITASQAALPAKYRRSGALSGCIIELVSPVPVIDREGEAAGIGETRYGLVAANTCDIARMGDTEKVEYAPIAPLVPLALSGMDQEEAQSARDSKLSRIFFVPERDGDVVPHIEDFTRLAPIHRDALRGRAVIRARTCRAFRVVLDACLVRLLCRADGRNA